MCSHHLPQCTHVVFPATFNIVNCHMMLDREVLAFVNIHTAFLPFGSIKYFSYPLMLIAYSFYALVGLGRMNAYDSIMYRTLFS